MRKIRPQTRGFGCTAIFAIFCLTFFTAGEAALVWYLNPDWFDRHAWWRGPILEPDLLIAQDKETRARRRAEQVRLLTTAEVSGQYDPGQGLTLKNPSYAELQISPGAIGEAASVRMTPVMFLPTDMGIPLAGPVYDIRVGNQEHYDFRGEVTITLPYDPETTDKPHIAVWEKGAWTQLSSTVDRDKKTVKARVPHLSLLSVGGDVTLGSGTAAAAGVLSLIYFVRTSPTLMGNGEAVAWFFAPSPKVTTNFVIHYMKSGEHRVIPDMDYVLKGGRSSGDHPLFVEDIAAALEDSMTRLNKIGITLPAPKALRHDVFLMKFDDLGESDVGGPVFISTTLATAHEETKVGNTIIPIDPRGLLRATVAHELCHVAQRQYYSWPTAHLHPWWIELSAEYLGDRCWLPENDYNTVRKYTVIRNGGPNIIGAKRLPTLPMDAPYSARTYCHALFFQWLDERYAPDGGLKVVRDLYERADTSLAAIDQSTQRQLQSGLGDLFVQYARDYYYRDLWHGTLNPLTHSGMTPEQQALEQIACTPSVSNYLTFDSKTFAWLTTSSERYEFASVTVPKLDHLTASALYVHSGVWLPEVRKGKLVIKTDGIPAGVRFSYVTDKIINPNNPLPFPGSPGHFFDGPQDGTQLILDKYATTGGDSNNRATLLFVNTSLTNETAPFQVKRWLLLAPAWLNANRHGSPAERQVKLVWHKAELADYPEVFKGYNVYRRKAGGEPLWELIKQEHFDESYTDPTDQDYIYGVRVKDVLGNLSEIKEQDNDDPWVGTWEGDIKLIEGSFVTAIRRDVKKICDDHDRTEQERINKIQEPQDRANSQRRHAEEVKTREEILSKVLELVDVVEQVTRIGVPMQVKIRHADGKYYLAITEIVWQPTGWTPADDLELTREDMNTLKVKAMPPEFAPFLLRLYRAPPRGPNHVRGDWTLDVPNDPNQTRFRFSWDFKRK